MVISILNAVINVVNECKKSLSVCVCVCVCIRARMSIVNGYFPFNNNTSQLPASFLFSICITV